jgi:hypothetical protein
MRYGPEQDGSSRYWRGKNWQDIEKEGLWQEQIGDIDPLSCMKGKLIGKEVK